MMQTATVHAWEPLDESAVLARTTMRAHVFTGRAFVAIYGRHPTPVSDDILRLRLYPDPSPYRV